MTQIVNATFDGGSFRPDERPDLAPQSRVRLIVEPLPAVGASADEALLKLDELCESEPITSAGTRLTRDQLHERD